MAGFAVTELATHLHKSTGTVERIIGDGLDVRHRFPRLWQRPRHRTQKVASHALSI